MRLRSLCRSVVVGVALACVGIGLSLALPARSVAAAAATKAPKAQVIKIDAGPVRYEPRVITVTVGQPVVLRITNSSTIDHEALLGNEKVQNDHAKEMKAMAGMEGHDHTPSVGKKPGDGFVEIAPKKTGEIRTTFTKVGRTILGCHLPGHYEGGMRLTVIVRAPSLGAAAK